MPPDTGVGASVDGVVSAVLAPVPPLVPLVDPEVPLLAVPLSLLHALATSAKLINVAPSTTPGRRLADRSVVLMDSPLFCRKHRSGWQTDIGPL